jgi:hypothetical protein
MIPKTEKKIAIGRVYLEESNPLRLKHRHHGEVHFQKFRLISVLFGEIFWPFWQRGPKHSVQKSNFHISPIILLKAFSKGIPDCFHSLMVGKKNKATNASARVTWESDNHLLSSFNRLTSIREKFAKLGRRNLTPLMLRISLGVKSKQNSAIVYIKLTSDCISYSKGRMLLPFY